MVGENFSILIVIFFFFHYQSQLTPLLKTAEELRIKGLAQVSWRDNPVTSTLRADEVEDGDQEDEEEMCASPAKRLCMNELPHGNPVWNTPMPVMVSTYMLTLVS